MTQIYLIRHCESLANVKAVIAGHADYDISSKGAVQLQYLSQRFKGIALDAFYSSPLTRAYKTALAANKYPHAPLFTDDRLMEMHMGHVDNKPFSTLTDLEKYQWNHQPHLFIPLGGESVSDAGERFYGALLDIISKHKDQTIAVAAHGGVYRSLFCMLRKLPWERIKEVDFMDNTGVSLITVGDDGVWEIVYENDTSHLPADAAPIPVSSWK